MLLSIALLLANVGPPWIVKRAKRVGRTETAHVSMSKS